MRRSLFDERKIGVYLCDCGANIAGNVNVAEVAEFVKELPSVNVTREYKFMCSEPGQDIIKKDIKELGINRVGCCFLFAELPRANVPGAFLASAV